MPAVSNLANRGRALEELLETVFRGAGPGVCMFWQANRVVLLRDGRAFPQKGAPIDFVGVIDGVPIAVECKEVSSERLSLGPGRFPEKEIRALQKFYRAGGRSYIVAAFWKNDVLAVFGFENFFKRWSEGTKSVTFQDADCVLPVQSAWQIVKILSSGGFR